MVIILDLDGMEINLVRYPNVECLKMSSNCWSSESPRNRGEEEEEEEEVCCSSLNVSTTTLTTAHVDTTVVQETWVKLVWYRHNI
ncbi:unnamed protein product [Sphagnum troendelagicum]|uniref:Uncharacterized protein n=1 Tax=Sphagnum troendelagicum TaxID=128251 RepID=A0ABP0TNB5_9BRYO